jgi:hypothetical protein
MQLGWQGEDSPDSLADKAKKLKETLNILVDKAKTVSVPHI